MADLFMIGFPCPRNWIGGWPGVDFPAGYQYPRTTFLDKKGTCYGPNIFRLVFSCLNGSQRPSHHYNEQVDPSEELCSPL